LSTVELPDAPAIPGLAVRHYAGGEDLPALAELMNRANKADQLVWAVTVEGLANEFTDLEHCDPPRDVLLAEIDGALVAATQASWADQADGMSIYRASGWVDPDWRRRGLGRALLHANERRLREIAADRETSGPRAFQLWAIDRQEGAQALALDEGYAPVRYFFLMIRPHLDEIPDLALPDGLELRPVRPEDALQVARAEDEAFLDHWGSRHHSDADLERILRDPSTDTTLWQVAWDGDEVAGVVVPQIEPLENEMFGYLRGWINRVSVRRPWRRRGLASALTAAGLRVLRERGMTSAQLGVDSENPTGAVGVYERLGLAVAERATTFRKPLE
jgi:mycothiol synthase